MCNALKHAQALTKAVESHPDGMEIPIMLMKNRYVFVISYVTELSSTLMRPDHGILGILGQPISRCSMVKDGRSPNVTGNLVGFARFATEAKPLGRPA